MILGGHFHYSSYSTFAGIPVSVASATCYISDIAPDERFISAVDAEQSVNVVHLYDDRVVTSIVPTHDWPEINGYGMDVAPLVEAMCVRGAPRDVLQEGLRLQPPRGRDERPPARRLNVAACSCRASLTTRTAGVRVPRVSW